MKIDPNTILSCFSSKRTLLEVLHEIRDYLIEVNNKLSGTALNDELFEPKSNAIITGVIPDEETQERIKKGLPIRIENNIYFLIQPAPLSGFKLYSRTFLESNGKKVNFDTIVFYPVNEGYHVYVRTSNSYTDEIPTMTENETSIPYATIQERIKKGLSFKYDNLIYQCVSQFVDNGVTYTQYGATYYGVNDKVNYNYRIFSLNSETGKYELYAFDEIVLN